MCGFLAEFDLTKGFSEESSPKISPDAESQILRRGPDFLHRIKESKFNVSFAHLGITDVSHGVQPFYTSNGFLAFGNGEIYNSLEVLSRLNLPEYVLSDIGTHDIKIAAELLSKDPEANWEQLDGMFSILLYGPDGEIFLGRDRAGEKPAFYFVSDKRLIFGSSVEAVAMQVGMPLALDQKQFNNWLAFGGCDVGTTLFSEIREVRPGSVIKFSKKAFSEFRYWHWPVRGTEYNIPKNYQSEILKIVESCRVKDFDGCLFWSGGVDSTAIRQSLSLSGFTPDSIHVSFDEKTYNEDLPEINQNLGKSREMIILFEDWLNELAIKEAINLMDQPISDAACLPLLAACIEAKENSFRVVYTGDGADEILRGYQAIRYEKYLILLIRLLRLVPKLALRGSFDILSRKSDRKYLSKLSVFLRLIAAALVDKSYSQQILVSPNFFIATTFPEVLDSNEVTGPTNLEEYFQAFILPQIYLQKTDRMASGIGLEARSPWLSKLSIETSMRFGEKFLSKAGKPLSMILSDDDRLRKKSKHGLGVPLKRVLTILQRPTWTIPELSSKKLDQIWSRALRGSPAAQNAAWSLYILNEKIQSWRAIGIMKQ